MVNADAMRKRIDYGWSDEDAMDRPLGCSEWRWRAERRLGYPVTRAIREMRSEGYTYAFIGIQLGCWPQTAWRIGNGR